MSTTSALTNLIARTPGSFTRGLGRMVAMGEGAAGYSHIKFIQDNGIALLPRLMVSRSKTESAEITFIEIAESLVYSYGITAAAKYLFQHLYHGVVGKGQNFNKGLLQKTVGQLSKNPQLAKKVIPVKAAVLLGAIGLTTVGFQYSLHFAKNLMTHYFFKKNQFSDIVNLSQDRSYQHDNNPVVVKAKKRIAQSLGLAAAMIGGALVLARFGHKLPEPLFKNMAGLVKRYDFDSTQGAFGLSRNLFRYVFAPINVIGYLDASRDNLERVEVGSRLLLVVSALMYGKEAFEGLLSKSMKSKVPYLFNAKGELKDLAVIAKEANKLPAKDAVKTFGKALNAKNKLFGYPLLLSILLPGFGVALLNRVWTNYRFHRNEASSNTTEAVGVNRSAAEVTVPQGLPSALPGSSPNLGSYNTQTVSPFVVNGTNARQTPYFVMQQTVHNPYRSYTSQPLSV